MASTYSTNLAIELIGTGDQAGSWGNTTNTNLGTLIEQAISGYVTQAVSTGTDTTITIPNGATGVARNMYIELTGTGGASTNLIVPANKKLYFIFNNTSSGQVTVKVSGQTGVSVPNKAKMILVSNGTDIVDATNYIGNISAASANITVLTSASATITNLIATSASITTLTNNPTFSGGTANGVLYLNGSKVATSGSALTFNGTTLVNTGPLKVGDGAASNTSRLMVNNATNTATGIQLFQDGIESWIMGMPANSAGLAWSASGAEQMRLNATGLGIGTASPAYRLDVNRPSYGVTARFYTLDGTNNPRLIIYGSAAGTTIQNTFSTGAANLMFAIGGAEGSGTEVARFDNTGNLGLGVTPSAWVNATASQVGFGAAISSRAAGSTASDMSHAAYWNGTNWLYQSSSVGAARYQMTGANAGSTHAWFVSAGGTAGNAISFTQAMTLDASGNLALGGTSNKVTGLSGSGSGFTVQASAAPTIGVWDTSDTSYYLNLSQISENSYLWNIGNGILSFGTNNTERGRFSAAGNFGISEGNNPTQVLSLYRAGSTNALMSAGNSNTGLDGAWFGVDTTGNGIVNVRGSFPLLFSTNANERGRFTAGGYFKASNAGTYQGSTLAYHELRTDAADYSTIVGNTNASPYGAYILFGSADPNNSTNLFLLCNGWNGSSLATRATIRSNGGLANYQSNNVDLSDARTKKDIAPAASMWDKIGTLEIVTYKYNDQTHDDVNVGVIAQQVESVEPVWVDADGFGETPEGEEPLKTVYTKDITFAAIKALQEAMARIEQLEADMAALKASA